MTKKFLVAPLVIIAAGCTGSATEESESVGEAQGAIISGHTYTLNTLNRAGSCMDSGTGTVDGTNIQQWTCNGSNAQKYQLVALDKTYFKLVNVNANKCVKVANGGLGDGANVQLW